MDITKEFTNENRKNLTKIAMIYLSLFLFFIASMNVYAYDNVSRLSNFYLLDIHNNVSNVTYHDEVSANVNVPVSVIGVVNTLGNTDTKVISMYLVTNDMNSTISGTLNKIEYNADKTKVLYSFSGQITNTGWTIVNTASGSVRVYSLNNLNTGGYPSITSGNNTISYLGSSGIIIDGAGQISTTAIANYYYGIGSYKLLLDLPNTNFSDNALKLNNVNALIGKAALNYQTTVTWSGTSKVTEESQKLQVVFGVKNETGSTSYENISPLLMDYDVTNNMYSTFLTQLETLYATSHSMSVDDIYIEYLRLCPYYEQGENKVWGQYTYLNFNESYTSYTVTTELNSFEEIEYSDDEKSDIYSNYDESLGYLDGVVFSILNVDDDDEQTLTGLVYHKFVWNDTHPTYIGTDYRVMAYWQLDTKIKSTVNQKYETVTTGKYKFGTISSYDDLEAMISMNTIQQSSNYSNAISNIENIKSKYLLPGVFMDIIYYLRIEKLNTTTGVYDYGGWVKIAPQNSYSGSMSKTATAVIESEDGTLITDTDSSYGDGVNQDTTEFGNGETIEDAINNSEIDYTNTDISLSWFFDTLENLSDELGKFPELFSKVFSFLPVQVTLFLSLGISAVVILRFLGR